MNGADRQHMVLPSAREDALRATPSTETVQTRSPSYRLAFTDIEFLLREELRPVRLQLELLKPELELQSRAIEGTIVIFGSARILEPEAARQATARAEQAAQESPDDAGLAKALAITRCV